MNTRIIVIVACFVMLFLVLFGAFSGQGSYTTMGLMILSSLLTAAGILIGWLIRGLFL